MRVLHVYQVYRPDDFTGIPRVIWELCEGMVKLGVESEVLCLSKNPSPEPIRIGNHLVHQVRRDFRLASASFSFSIFKKFRDLIKNFDLVNYHYPCPLADLLYLAHGRSVPSVVTYHSDIVKQKALDRLYAPVRSLFLRRVDRLVATSPNYLESSKILTKYRYKTSIVPIGIGDRESPEAENLKKWQSHIGDGFFLFVGSLRYYKGLSILIDAARSTGMPVVIAGRGEINTSALPDNVTYVGEVSDNDKECLLSLCKAFIFPSFLRSEAFGVALLEAARAGRPMISYEIGTGTSYVNKAEETGIIVDPGDAGGLSSAMQFMFENDHVCQRLGENARKRYEDLFKADKASFRYIRIYKDLTFK